ncbi:MAG: tyrosine-type recombinase/integrase [Sandaracinus sp.]
MTAGVIVSRAPLHELFAAWLAAIASALDEATWKTYKLYAKTHFIPYFAQLSSITEASWSDYVTARLRKVLAKSIRKEASAMRGFLGWCKTQGYISVVPSITSPSKRVQGTRDTSKDRKRHAQVLAVEEVEAVLAALPERQVRGKGRPRAYYTLMFETGLRPATLDGLRAPDDYRRGAFMLNIRAENDKTRFERALPLTPRARAVLDAVCPDEGPIFGAHDYRVALRAAAIVAGIDEERGRRLSDYDFRHTRATILANGTKKLGGVAYLLGHKHVTTTNTYVHPGFSEAAGVLEEVAAPAPKRAPSKRRTGTAKASA